MLLIWGLGMVLEEGEGGASVYDTLGVGLEEVVLEGGSVQWLIMVEVVFRGGLFEVRGVGKRGVSAVNILTSQL